MGCTQSKLDPHQQEEINSLQLLLKDSQLSAAEQQNLLRFKIEVLVNMLAMEEKKSASTTKRLETMKWLIHSQGVSEQTLTDILKQSEENNGEMPGVTSPKSGEVMYRGAPLIDLSGAIERMFVEFESFRNDILHAFAEEDGKIVTQLEVEDFSKQLYTVTQNVSKTDIHVSSNTTTVTSLVLLSNRRLYRCYLCDSATVLALCQYLSFWSSLQHHMK